MFMRIPTIRSKMAVGAALAALVAGMLAAPAAAETKHKRWLPNHDSATRSGNVEQGGRQVNRRYDGNDRGKPPAWLPKPGERGRKGGNRARNYQPYPPGQGGRDRRHDGRQNPPPQYADRDYRRGDERRYKHKGGKDYYYYNYSGRHGHQHHRHNHRRPRYDYSYSFYYLQPQPRVIYYPVPYHMHDYGAAYGHHRQGTQTAACSDGYGDGGRYVMAGSHQPGGTILGGIVGAAIGSQFGGGKGRLAAVGVGTLFGALIGSDIGRTMDEADRAYAAGSFGQAMEYAPTCSQITWNNPQSGSNGTVTPMQTFEPEPGRYCREFQQQVVIGGQIQDAYGTACRQPDGSWEIVTE